MTACAQILPKRHGADVCFIPVVLIFVPYLLFSFENEGFQRTCITFNLGGLLVLTKPFAWAYYPTYNLVQHIKRFHPRVYF